MWGLPGPGTEPVSPTLAGGFLIHQGSPYKFIYCPEYPLVSRSFRDNPETPVTVEL